MNDSKAKWAEADLFLGRASDGDIAAYVGVTASAVRRRRQKLGVSAGERDSLALLMARRRIATVVRPEGIGEYFLLIRDESNGKKI